MDDSPTTLPIQDWSLLQQGREVLSAEGRAVLGLAEKLDESFCRAVDFLFTCQGSVIVIGMGKAGLIGQKIAATLASTGTRSHFLHPAEAIHGDLGRIHRDDSVVMLSHSGETEEIVRLLPYFAEFRIPVMGITGNQQSRLARSATITLYLGDLREAGTLGLAPSTSTTAMLALGDALALVTSRLREFNADDFARFHPGGSLGRKLAKVDDIMRPLCQCRVSDQSHSVREVLVGLGRPGRRSGAVLLTTSDGRLSGIFTDSDLARLFEQQRDACLDRPVREVMTPSPSVIDQGSPMATAIDILIQRKISELPVVDHRGHPVGMLDVTDVMEFLPNEARDEHAGMQTASERRGHDGREVEKPMNRRAKSA